MTVATQMEVRLSTGCVLQWIHDTPAYKKRWLAMDAAARRNLIQQPITEYDVRTSEAMMSIFDKCEDLAKESV